MRLSRESLEPETPVIDRRVIGLIYSNSLVAKLRFY
jgi:hypothetical protein